MYGFDITKRAEGTFESLRKTYSVQKLREMCSATRAGVSLLGISDAAEKLGLDFK